MPLAARRRRRRVAAVGGAVVLGVHALAVGLIRPLGVARAIDVPFLCFVVGLAVRRYGS